MKGLSNFFHQLDDTQSIIHGIKEGLKEQLVTGLSGSSRAILIANIYKDTRQSIVVVTHNLHQAQKVFEDLQAFLAEEEVFLYPANELIATEMSVASPELKAQRIEVLNHLVNKKDGVIVVPISGLKKLLPPRELWEKHQLKIKVEEELSVERALRQFVQMGYVRVDMVTAPGEFSVRGGIVDIYPLTEANPLRIELFDDEIDSIRSFQVNDQRSIEKHTKVSIGPATEIILEANQITRIVDQLEQGLAKSLKKTTDEKRQSLLSQQIRHEIEEIKENKKLDYIFKYVSLAYEQPHSLLDYLARDGIIILDEMSRIQETNDLSSEEEAEWYMDLLNEGKIIHDMQISHDLSTLLQATEKARIYLSLFLRHVPHTSPDKITNISCKQTQEFHGQMHLLKTEIDRWEKADYSVVFLAENKKRVQKLQHILDDYEIGATVNTEETSLFAGATQIVIGKLQGGFELPLEKLVVLTEGEIFKKRRSRRPRHTNLSNAERIKSYSELKAGDYVVHVSHGIGKYLGIETLTIGGVHKDYLHISYRGDDKLYVPVDQINLVQKYVAAEGKQPKVYKLGGSDWKKVKSRVQSSVQDIADDLIKLYAEREAQKGHSFSPDGDMQREFEASFMYRETDDQLRSIDEIKKDMEKERPMDRLLCGDVGYGKTEVAIRAAFKAIADDKQVAFLVPTTILAQQHYATIEERFQNYPINIGVLSRFKSRKEQLETIKGLKNGTIDLVIGTHRILSKDIGFRDLGLLIVDEEQRFGVTHKEKIKQLKTNVDVLTLTATPIPRTLHMSMLGVRDLSVIETPPENRFPVQTYVMEHNAPLVREAVERELARGGQVYYLYNRVEDIERKASEISALVPEARVAHAHGQMTENQLESVMLGFLAGEYDVLVSTTIIETGVDIPNVNTLIVYDADKMGLSQLYQLRGRVGRSNRVAYAYLTYQKDKVLTEIAEQRLQAIKEFTELGSGFKIAMRDLSIRGAGNILGAAQHGFIDSVGFDLYSQMLTDAIEERKGHAPKEEQQLEIDLNIDAYLPDAYIPDGYQKIDMYKRFRGIDSLEDIEELKEEMMDRFGDYPAAVAYLFQISVMKVVGKVAGIESIKQENEDVVLLLSESRSSEIGGKKVMEITAPYGRMIGLGMHGSKFKIVLHVHGIEAEKWLQVAEEIIVGLSKVIPHEKAAVLEEK